MASESWNLSTSPWSCLTFSWSSLFFFSSSRRTSTNVWNGDFGSSLRLEEEEWKAETSLGECWMRRGYEERRALRTTRLWRWRGSILNIGGKRKIFQSRARVWREQPASAYGWAENAGGISRITTVQYLSKANILIPILILTEICPNFLCGHCYPLLHTSKTVQGWSDVQRKYWRAVRLGRCRVVVNDIADLLTGFWTSDYPIVSVKGRLRATTDLEDNDTWKLSLTYLNREGSSHPANIQKRAFGDSSPGRPLNRAKWISDSEQLQTNRQWQDKKTSKKWRTRAASSPIWVPPAMLPHSKSYGSQP